MARDGAVAHMKRMKLTSDKGECAISAISRHHFFSVMAHQLGGDFSEENTECAISAITFYLEGIDMKVEGEKDEKERNRGKKTLRGYIGEKGWRGGAFWGELLNNEGTENGR
jgi:hypothetical protein